MTEQSEGARRTMNIVEAVTLAGIIGLATMLFSMRDSLIQVQEQIKAQNMILATMQLQLADVPTLSQRVSRVEVRQENILESVKEIRTMKGLK